MHRQLAFGAFVLVLGTALTAHGYAQLKNATSEFELVVVDESGAALPGAKVLVRDRDKSEIANGLTNGLGGFSISQMPLGAYEITVVRRGFQEISRTAVVEAHLACEVRISLHPSPLTDPVRHGDLSLSVIIEDEAAAVVPRADVKIRQDGTGAEIVGLSDATGKYQIAQLAAGSYSIQVEKAGFKPHRTTVMLHEHEAHAITMTMSVASVQSGPEIYPVYPQPSTVPSTVDPQLLDIPQNSGSAPSRPPHP